MENQENIHYRVGGKLTHAGVECLPQGQDIPRIVIERIEYKEKETINGRVEEGVWIAHFAPNPYTSLPFILNATNRKRLIKQFPQCEGYPARLKNVAVRLTREKCRDVQDGGDTWGLRISKLPADDAPAAPAKKVLNESQVGVIVEWAKKYNLDINGIAKQYDFESDAVKNAIIKGISSAPVEDDLP